MKFGFLLHFMWSSVFLEPLPFNFWPMKQMNEVLSREEYYQIKKELDHRPRMFQEHLVMVSAMVFDFCLLSLLIHYRNCWLAVPFFSICLLRSFLWMHEFGHGFFLRAKFLNNFFGHLCSSFVGLPYYSWKYIHQKHHYWAGNHRYDPTLNTLREVKEKGGVPKMARWLWRTRLPFISVNQHVTVWKFSVDHRLTPSQKHLCKLSMIFTLFLQGAVFYFISAHIILLSMLCFFFFLEWITLPHHFGRPTNDNLLPPTPWDQAIFTRTATYPYAVFSFLFLNFNLHTEHHLFSWVAWYRLPTIRHLVCRRATVHYQEVSAFSFNRLIRTKNLWDIVLGVRFLRNRRTSTQKVPKKLFRRLVLLLPQGLRYSIYRSLIQLDWRPPRELTIQIANHETDLHAAYQLLYDEYTRNGLMQTNASGLRITEFHRHGKVVTLVAKWNETVIGTIGIVVDSRMGLPMDSIFDLKKYRSIGAVAEITSFAIEKSFQGNQGRILFPLTKLMWQYARDHLRVKFLLAAVHPTRTDFYRAILMLDPISSPVVKAYTFANNAPAAGLVLDLNKAWVKASSLYSGKPAQQDLFRYYARVPLNGTIHYP